MARGARAERRPVPVGVLHVHRLPRAPRARRARGARVARRRARGPRGAVRDRRAALGLVLALRRGGVGGALPDRLPRSDSEARHDPNRAPAPRLRPRRLQGLPPAALRRAAEARRPDGRPPRCSPRARAPTRSTAARATATRATGRGPAARGLRPPPRDFTLGVFKFAAVPAGTLPHDDDLERIVRGGPARDGHAGVGRHPRAAGAGDHPVREDVLPALEGRGAGRDDPAPGGRLEGPRGRGRRARPEALPRARPLPGLPPGVRARRSPSSRRRRSSPGSASADFREDMYGSTLTESEFGVKLLPPDFTRSSLRSIRTITARRTSTA